MNDGVLEALGWLAEQAHDEGQRRKALGSVQIRRPPGFEGEVRLRFQWRAPDSGPLCAAEVVLSFSQLTEEPARLLCERRLRDVLARVDLALAQQHANRYPPGAWVEHAMIGLPGQCQRCGVYWPDFARERIPPGGCVLAWQREGAWTSQRLGNRATVVPCHPVRELY